MSETVLAGPGTRLDGFRIPASYHASRDEIEISRTETDFAKFISLNLDLSVADTPHQRQEIAPFEFLTLVVLHIVEKLSRRLGKLVCVVQARGWLPFVCTRDVVRSDPLCLGG